MIETITDVDQAVRVSPIGGSCTTVCWPHEVIRTTCTKIPPCSSNSFSEIETIKLKIASATLIKSDHFNKLYIGVQKITANRELPGAPVQPASIVLGGVIQSGHPAIIANYLSNLAIVVGNVPEFNPDDVITASKLQSILNFTNMVAAACNCVSDCYTSTFSTETICDCNY